MPASPATRQAEEGDHKFKASLGSLGRLPSGERKEEERKKVYAEYF